MAQISHPSRQAGAAAALRLALALVAVLLPLGCGSSSPSEPRGEVAFQSLVKTKLVPRIGPEIRRVVRDQASWDAVWRELWGPSPPVQPAIDFRREMVVVATASLSCAGDVTIERVAVQTSGVAIGLADASPASRCLCFAPELAFEVVRAPRIDGPATFQVRPVAPTCG